MRSYYVQEQIDNLGNYNISLNNNATQALKKVLKENYKFNPDKNNYQNKTSDFVMNQFNKEMQQYSLDGFDRDIPTLLLLADEPNLPLEIKNYFNRSLTNFGSSILNFEVYSIKNSHHLLMFTNPKETSEYILAFITKYLMSDSTS